jgi:hypothetical protein
LFPDDASVRVAGQRILNGTQQNFALDGFGESPPRPASWPAPCGNVAAATQKNNGQRFGSLGESFL